MLFCEKIQGKDVTITLNAGLHSVGFWGAVGKSYLFSLLEAYSSISENEGKLLLFTFNAERREEELFRRVQEFNGELVMLDRFDLYYSDRVMSLLEEKDMPSIIDLKDSLKWNQYKFQFAQLNFQQNSMEVRYFGNTVTL